MKIVLLGTCEFAWFNVFESSLRNCNAKVYAFSFRAVHPLSHIYSLYRKKNRQIFEEAELIIISPTAQFFKDKDHLKHFLPIYNNIYKILSRLQKKVLIIQWQHCAFCHGGYKSFHKIQSEKYGFNFIDAYDFCFKEKLLDFYMQIVDAEHPMAYVYSKMAQNICENFIFFKKPKKNISLDIPDFKVLDLDEILDFKNSNFINQRTNLYKENTYNLKNSKELKLNFPKEYLGMKILGVYYRNNKDILSYCVFENKNQKVLQGIYHVLSFNALEYNFIIDSEIKIHQSLDEDVKKPLLTWFDKTWENNKEDIGIIGFLLVSEEVEDLKISEDIEIKISEEYDFTHLCEYLKEYKIIIEQYNQRKDPIKLAPLQNQIKEKDNIIFALNQEKTTLQNELNSLPVKKQHLELANLEQDLKNKELQSFILKKELGDKFVKNININYIDKNSAKARIQNHLSYKLGQALIENSKSILGYIRMPYVLSYIKDKHKFEQKAYEEKIKENPNLALPPLETYSDYQEALKEKECFTYKLGEALIQANKNWYGGGYIKFYFKDVPRLKREFGKR